MVTPIMTSVFPVKDLVSAAKERITNEVYMCILLLTEPVI